MHKRSGIVVVGQRRGQLAVGLGLGQEVLGFLHDKLHSVGSGDPSQRRLVLIRELDERVGELGGVTTLQKHYQCTAIDDCTRIRVLRIYDRLNQATAIRFVDYVVEKLPFAVEMIQTHNGPEFGSRFHYHVLDAGIGHVYIKPATPRLNGKVERSHRIDQEEFYRMLKGVVIDDTELFDDRLQEWEDFYNYNRPRGGLGGQTRMRG